MKLLKFAASWCVPCKQQGRIFEQHGLSIPVENIDVERDTVATAQYSVQSVPTLVLVDDEGKELYRWRGITYAEVIEAKIEELK